MTKMTFDAHFAILESRWKWRPEEADAMDFFRKRLWAAVHRWKGPQADAFCVAIEGVIADQGQYGRPSVEGILERARTAGAKPESNPELERRHRLRSATAQFVAEGWLTHRSTVGQMMALIGCSDSEARSLFSQFVRRRQCHACGFGIAYLRGIEILTRETATGMEWVHPIKPSFAWYECAECRKVSKGALAEWGESPEEGGPRDDESRPFAGPPVWRSIVEDAEERAAIRAESAEEERKARIVQAVADYALGKRT